MYFIAEEVWVLFDLKIILSIVNLLLSFYFTFYFFGGEGTIIFKFQFYKKKKFCYQLHSRHLLGSVTQKSQILALKTLLF